MKKIIALILAAAMAVCVFTSCGKNSDTSSSQPAQSVKLVKDGQKLLIKTDGEIDEMTAVFLNSQTGEKFENACEKLDGGIFQSYADPEKFDRVEFSYDGKTTEQAAFNSFVSGWNLSVYGVWPFTEGVESEPVDYALAELQYGNEKKNVYIWTPADYDKNSAEKYSVIYMTDGQNLFDENATATGSWGVAESAVSMMKQSGNRVIIVGVENPSVSRDNELTPDIGDVTSSPEKYEDGNGKLFSDFVVNTVAPYVEKNYNVYSDPAHVSVCGSSSGGLECFHIGMEHPEKFGTIGALSPAFLLYDDATWEKYFSEKKFGDDSPFVYIYCGNGDGDELEKALMLGTKSMLETLKKVGYPEDKIFSCFYEDGIHNELYWRAVFPDFLKYAFSK